MVVSKSGRFMSFADLEYNFKVISRDIIEDIEYNDTPKCRCDLENKMSTVGHAAFAVCKVKENRQKSLQKIQAAEDERKPFNVNYNMEYNPMKYNSKLMNSIWGMYNRYSVHNLKKIMDDIPAFAVSQQGSVGNTATLDRSAGNTKTATGPAKNLMQNWMSTTDYSY